MRALTLLALVIALPLGAAGCADRSSDGGDFEWVDPNVDSLPDGDAVGTDYSGVYIVVARLLECTGTCEHPDPDDASSTVNICDRDGGGESQIILTQLDGHLHVEIINDYGEFDGGIGANGQFDVLRTWTNEDDTYGENTRVAGNIFTDGVMKAVAVLAASGSQGGVPVECELIYDIDGELASS